MHIHKMDDGRSLTNMLKNHISQKKGGAEFGVEILMRSLSVTDRSDMVRALKTLHSQGYGQFISGRRGFPSRFKLGGAIEFKSDISPSKPSMEEEVPAPSERTADGHTVTFAVRMAPLFMIALPADITRAETQRISAWLETLPIDNRG